MVVQIYLARPQCPILLIRGQMEKYVKRKECNSMYKITFLTEMTWETGVYR